MIDDDNLIRATGYLCLQLALLEDVVDKCATALGVRIRCLDYTDRGLTAKIGCCTTEAQTLTEAGVALGELPVVLDAADALSQRAQTLIVDCDRRRPRVGGLAADPAVNTGDRITAAALQGVVREVEAVAIQLIRLTTVIRHRVEER
jgi:hypothetical protein